MPALPATVPLIDFFILQIHLALYTNLGPARCLTHVGTEGSLDPSMHIERWDKTAKVTYDKRVFAELISLRFIESHQHVIVLGPYRFIDLSSYEFRPMTALTSQK